MPENEELAILLSNTAETRTVMNINLYMSEGFQNYKHITHERGT